MKPRLTFIVEKNPDRMIKIINNFLIPRKKSFDWSFVYANEYPNFRKEIFNLKDPKEIKKKSLKFFKKFFQENKGKLEKKQKLFQEDWNKNGENILKVLSKILEKEWPKSCENMKAWVSLNPICPRYLSEKSFEVFWKSDEKQMKAIAVHEILHFIWFAKWNDIFPKSNPKKEFESPHLIWKLSEIVPKAILGDKLMQEVFQHEPNVYKEWKTITIKGKPLLEHIQEIYDNKKDMEDFMKKSYGFLKKYEEELK